MGLAQQEHAQAGLANAAADGEGQLALQQQLVEGKLPPCLAPGEGELTVQGGGVHPDAHGGQLKSPLQHWVPHQDIPVEGPVVVVGGPAVVWAARLERAADAHQEGDGMLFHPGILPLLGGAVGPELLQLLGGDEGDLRPQRRKSGELGKDRAQGVLGLCHGRDNGAHGLPEIVGVPVPGGNDLLPVPLIHIDGVQVVQLLVPADGVHVGVEALTHGELVAVEGHPLPLGQGVDHLCVPPGVGNVEGDGPLHAVEIVVQAGGGLHKQGGGDPAQVQRAAQRILKQALEQANGLLSVIEVQTGGVPLWNDRLQHKKAPFPRSCAILYHIIQEKRSGGKGGNGGKKQ